MKFRRTIVVSIASFTENEAFMIQAVAPGRFLFAPVAKEPEFFFDLWLHITLQGSYEDVRASLERGRTFGALRLSSLFVL